MVNSRTVSENREKSVSIIKFFFITSILATFLIFRLISFQDNSNSQKSIKGILRSESLNGNSYALSKALSDLEMLEIASCITLIEKTESSRMYYDTSGNDHCFRNQISRMLFEAKTEIVSINGLKYNLTFQLPFSWSFIFLEILSYILIGLAFYLFLQNRKREILNHTLKLTAVELEKDMVLELTSQAKHDITSPLTALRTIVIALNNIDPEIKDFLNRAVTRTEEIFKLLSQSDDFKKTPISSFELSTCLDEIIVEKHILWKRQSLINTESKKGDKIIVLGNDSEMKRIFSNILQNSFEASNPNRENKIDIELKNRKDELEISITDRGVGMSDETLKRICEKGYSFGKQDHQFSGSGLGTYHARNTLLSWGGNLIFKSVYGIGTTTTIILKRG